MGNEVAFAQINGWISMLQNAHTIPDEAMPDVAKRVEATWKADLAAGRDPETGKDWAPRKRDGARPMKAAASHAVAKSAGTSVTLMVTGPDAIHHYGVRGAEPRHVVPTGSAVPLKIGNAIRLGLFPVWQKRVAAAAGGK